MDAMNVRLPSRPLKIRSMKKREAGLVAEWIRQGREEGVFAHGLRVDPRSLAQYQNSHPTLGWTYACFIVEYESKPIGYFDVRFRRGVGEALGVYITAAQRGKGIGKLALQWAVAFLRVNGCKMIQAFILKGNLPSIGMCVAVGFTQHKSRKRFENKREVLVYRCKVPPQRHLSEVDPSYRALSGDNLYLMHVAIAEIVLHSIKRVKGVDLVLGLGSLARGFADEDSDIDLAIIGQRHAFERLWIGERWIAGISVDVFGVDPRTTPPIEWDASRKQAFEESVVLYSSGNRVLRGMVKELRLKRQERVYQVAETVLKLGWLGYEPPAWQNRVRFGYRWSLPPDLWMKRGSIESAHSTIDQAFDLTLQLLYLANGRRVPDMKWRWYCATALTWLPTGFLTAAKRLQSSKRTSGTFTLRSRLLLRIISATVRYVIDQRLLSGDIYRLYLQYSEDYNPSHVREKS